MRDFKIFSIALPAGQFGQKDRLDPYFPFSLNALRES
jgi:hypothetical protein